MVRGKKSKCIWVNLNAVISGAERSSPKTIILIKIVLVRRRFRRRIKMAFTFRLC